MARSSVSSGADAAPVAGPRVRYRLPPTGGDGTAPYQGPTYHEGPLDALPEGATVLDVIADADPAS